MMLQVKLTRLINLPFSFKMGTAPAVERTKLGSFSEASILLCLSVSAGETVVCHFLFLKFHFFRIIRNLTFNLSISIDGSGDMEE